jgi:hypothetical protein
VEEQGRKIRSFAKGAINADLVLEYLSAFLLPPSAFFNVKPYNFPII